VHLNEPGSEYVAAGHAPQVADDVAPATFEYVPAGHGVPPVLSRAATAQKVPRAHAPAQPDVV